MSPAVRFYASADGRSLGLFRIFLGLLLCVDLLSRLGVIEALYSNEGVLTNHFALYRPVERHSLSLFYAFSALSDVRVAVALALAAYLLFTVGYRTRITAALSLIAVVSLHARNLLAATASDALLHAWLLWAVLLPVGERFALDSLLRGALAEPRVGELQSQPEQTAQARIALPVAGTLLWLAALHAALTLSRSGPLWREGAALGYALRDPGWSTALGGAVASGVAEPILRALSYVVWVMPLAVAVLLLVPARQVRRVALGCMVLFHLAWGFLFRDALAGWAMCAAAPLLLGREDWEQWIRWRARRRPSLVVVYDADCGVCFLICRTLKRLDLYERLRLLPNDGPLPVDVPHETLATSVVVMKVGGDVLLTKSAACAAIVSALPGGRAAGWLLRQGAIAGVADRAYDAFAARRARVSQWLGFDACGVLPATSAGAPSPPRSAVRWHAGRALCAAGAIILAMLCAHALLQSNQRPPRALASPPLDIATRYAGLATLGDRLAPDPPRSVGVLVVDGVTPTGSHLDPLTKRAPRTSPLTGGSDPLHPAVLAFFERVSEAGHVAYVEGLRDYVKRIANAPSQPAPVSAFEMVWITAPLPETREAAMTLAAPVRVRLGAHP